MEVINVDIPPYGFYEGQIVEIRKEVIKRGIRYRVTIMMTTNGYKGKVKDRLHNTWDESIEILYRGLSLLYKGLALDEKVEKANKQRPSVEFLIDQSGRIDHYTKMFVKAEAFAIVPKHAFRARLDRYGDHRYRSIVGVRIIVGEFDKEGKLVGYGLTAHPPGYEYLFGLTWEQANEKLINRKNNPR